jgi:HEAT repeat protein
LESPNLTLHLAILKFLAHNNRELAIPILIEQLKNTIYKIRLVSLHRLGMLQAKEGISAIAICLHDHEAWVRISAAEALKKMGEEGEEVLKKSPLLERIPFDITEHISNTLW